MSVTIANRQRARKINLRRLKKITAALLAELQPSSNTRARRM
jgi:hypothetical protein